MKCIYIDKCLCLKCTTEKDIIAGFRIAEVYDSVEFKLHNYYNDQFFYLKFKEIKEE